MLYSLVITNGPSNLLYGWCLFEKNVNRGNLSSHHLVKCDNHKKFFFLTWLLFFQTKYRHLIKAQNSLKKISRNSNQEILISLYRGRKALQNFGEVPAINSGGFQFFVLKRISMVVVAFDYIAADYKQIILNSRTWKVKIISIKT